ncbi:hypothetical protein BJX99DRAFT_262973 [Aspergillus californicus]
MGTASPIPHRSGGKFMDPRALVSLLRKQYGPSNFRVDLQRDQYIIYVNSGKSPDSELTAEQIDTCRRRYW